MFPTSFDPALFGVLGAAIEEESAAAYQEGFSDGLRAAAYRLASSPDCEGDDLDGTIRP